MRCCQPHFFSFLVLPSQPPLLPLPCRQRGLMRFLPSRTLRLPMMSCLCWARFSLFSAGGSLGINGLSRCIRNTLFGVRYPANITWEGIC
jgi:hypothetical protein